MNTKRQVAETVYGKGAKVIVQRIARDEQERNPFNTVTTEYDGCAWRCFSREPKS